MSKGIGKIIYIDELTEIGYRIEVLSDKQDDIDILLDALPRLRTFISEDEFLKLHKNYDAMTILNEDGKRIGLLTTKESSL